MDDFLDKLQQLYKDNPHLAKVVEAYSIMDSLHHKMPGALSVQNQRKAVSQNTSDITIKVSDTTSSAGQIK